MRVFLVAPLLLAMAASASAFQKVPAEQVSVATNGWDNVAPTSTTAQATFQWIDENWPVIDSDGWDEIAPAADTAQDAFDWLDAWINTNAQPVLDAYYDTSFLPGTNIVGAVYSNGQWTVDSQTSGLMPGTNIVGATFAGLDWTINFPEQVSPGVGTNYFMALSTDSVTLDTEAQTLVTFTEVYDPNGWYASNTFTAPVDGLYLIHARVVFTLDDTPITKRSQLYLYKNGSAHGDIRDRVGDNIVTREINHFTAFERAEAGDTFQVYRSFDGTPGATTNSTRSFMAVLLSEDP